MVRKIALCLTVLMGCMTLASLPTSAQTTPKAPPPELMPNPFLKPKLDPEALERQRLFEEKVDPFWQAFHRNYAQGKLAEAEKACLQIIALNEAYYHRKDVIGLDLLGETYLRAGQNLKARNCFQQVFPLGYNASLYLNLALVDCRLGDVAEARKLYFSPVVQQHLTGVLLNYSRLTVASLPDTEDAAGLYASIAWACGMDRYSTSLPAEAIGCFQEADKQWASNPLVHSSWADALFELGRGKEAIPHYQLAITHGSGVLQKDAQESMTRAQQYVDTQARLKAQQAKQKTQEQVKTAP